MPMAVHVPMTVPQGRGLSLGKLAASEGSMTDEQELRELNIKIAEMEKRRDKDAEDFFREVLSGELIFRRVTGAVQGKSGFVNGLREAYPFVDLKADDIKVGLVDGLHSRVIVTLIIVGRRANGTEGRFRNIRLFSQAADAKYKWRLEFWYNYELTSL
jgi:hypothetical protein